jgi:hypothetical protein
MPKTKLAQRLSHPAEISRAVGESASDGVARSDAELAAWDVLATPPALEPPRYRVVSGAVGRWARGSVVSAEDIGGADRAAALAARGAVKAE